MKLKLFLLLLSVNQLSFCGSDDEQKESPAILHALRGNVRKDAIDELQDCRNDCTKNFWAVIAFCRKWVDCSPERQSEKRYPELMNHVKKIE